MALVTFFGLAKLFAARTCKAQLSASAAQGRIASGESIASSGALKKFIERRTPFIG